ncbi:uncharacterized protein YcsI (UPF0317 family) [Aequitasia blattaphilus]|uniref:Putative hydro-lyase NK125_00915 n=1 Tax=Aequitasia blattaphilus TaxID=2949332 RepID=A0ABT1E7Y5_9FIRM|nr:putative hydro-lyase [Aequitasia blattaphilus]MCP1100971.1 putative hydro-lyase [Aequitasia blattaphilus]MCR8613611.1 putative hydro-lyase [Aequitasia blattaphilus]
MDYSMMAPEKVRKLIREGDITGPTAGMSNGFAQANLVILPEKLAYDFLLFCQRNPRSCPLLEVGNRGDKTLPFLGKDIDITRDIPRYCVYEKGNLVETRQDISDLWKEDFVSFLIGCSFSFETALLDAGVPIRHIEEKCNVPMYKTNIPCAEAGVFKGNMVVSMRPLKMPDLIKATRITGEMPRVHGAPIHFGDPLAIGIEEIEQPDFGDKVTIKDGEIPVFWPCGVTPQNVVMKVKPEMVITHAPGHMLVTDIKNSALKY